VESSGSTLLLGFAVLALLGLSLVVWIAPPIAGGILEDYDAALPLVTEGLIRYSGWLGVAPLVFTIAPIVIWARAAEERAGLIALALIGVGAVVAAVLAVVMLVLPFMSLTESLT